MPQLPSEQSLGERPVPQSSAGMVPVQAGYEAAAVSQAGQAIEQIGLHLQQARRASSLADSIGAASEELGQKSLAYARDQDFATSPTRFKADAEEIGNRYAGQLDDPVVKQVFQREYTKLAVAKQLTMYQQAAKQEQDYNVARLDATQEQMAQSYAGAGSSLEQNVIANQFKIAVGELVHSGWITDVDGEKRMQRFGERADQATALRDINNNPQQAIQDLTDPTKYPRIDPVTRQQYVRAAEVRERQAEAIQNKGEADAEKKARNDLFEAAAKGSLTVGDIINSPASAVAKEHYLSMLKAQAKDALEKPIKSEPSVKLDVLNKIRTGEITDESQIESFYSDSVQRGRGITWQDMNDLRKEFQDARTPDGDRLSKAKVDFLNAIKPQIDKSNPLQGKFDAPGTEQLFQFKLAIDRKIADYRKAGKDPFDLFDASKPDYMAKPGALTPYQKTFTESMRDVTGKMRTSLPNVINAPARAPGESIDDYIKRTATK